MASFTESFNTSDGAALGPDLPWTEVVGSAWGVTSNAAAIQGGGGSGDSHARAEHDVSSADHYVEATLVAKSLPAGAGFRAAVGGIMARYDSASDSGLCFQVEHTSSGTQQFGLRRWVNGVESAQLAGHAQDPQIGDRLRIECEGTTVRCYVNDVLLIAHTGETMITAGTRGGLRGVLVGNAGTGSLVFDDFKIGDLAVAIPVPVTANVILMPGVPG